MTVKFTLEDRIYSFFDKIEIGGPDDCWEWKGGRNWDGVWSSKYMR